MAMATLLAGAGGEGCQSRAPKSTWPGHFAFGNRRRNKRPRIGESAERRGKHGSRVEDQQLSAGATLDRTIAALRAERYCGRACTSCFGARQHLPECPCAGVVSR